MTDINRLTRVSTLGSGDVFPLWSAEKGDTVGIAKSDMAAALLPNATGEVQVYAAPNATGFTVTLAGQNSQWLILTPVAGYAAGTIVLPSSPVNQQQVTVSCTQSVGTLTVSGGTINGAPASLSANGFFSMRFDGVVSAWYRVG